jgi:hypothetical protein
MTEAADPRELRTIRKLVDSRMFVALRPLNKRYGMNSGPV